MKIKVIVSLAVIVVILIGVLGGCTTSPKEETYRQVSVGVMTVSIPADWQKGEEDVIEAGRAGMPAGTTMDGYHDKPKNAILMLFCWGIK